MRSQVIVAVLLIAAILTAAAANAESRILKDGRQYAIDLARRLQITDREMLQALAPLTANAPRGKSVDNLGAALATYARLADYACNYVGILQPEALDDNELHQTFSDRPATKEEAALLIRNSEGRVTYFANCMSLALSKEFLTTVQR